MNNRNYILLICMFLWSCGKVYSQQSPVTQVDSLATDSIRKLVGNAMKTETEPDDEPTYFNALDYSMQKRYRIRKYPFQKGNIWSHTYVSVYGGVEKFSTRNNKVDMCVNNLIGLSVGKEFTEVHSARLTLQGGFANSQTSPDKYKRFGVEAAYLFNLSAYVWGYNPYRLFELSPVVGIGLNRAKGTELSRMAAGVYGGLQVKLHGYKGIDFFVEPALGIYSDGIDLYTTGNWHKYDLAYRLNAGVIYRFADPLKHEPTHTDEGGLLKDAFVSLAGGMQYQYSDYTKEMGIFSSARQHVQLSVGKWTRPYLGFRVSAFYGEDIWRDNTSTAEENELIHKQKGRYIGGRLEAMVNAFGFMQDKPWAERFMLSALAGAEIGGMTKQDLYLKKRIYGGFTGGLQAAVRITPHWGAFVEPRYSWHPYTFLPQNAVGEYMERVRYSDNIYSLNVGVMYNF